MHLQRNHFKSWGTWWCKRALVDQCSRSYSLCGWQTGNHQSWQEPTKIHPWHSSHHSRSWHLSQSLSPDCKGNSLTSKGHMERNRQSVGTDFVSNPSTRWLVYMMDKQQYATWVAVLNSAWYSIAHSWWEVLSLRYPTSFIDRASRQSWAFYLVIVGCTVMLLPSPCITMPAIALPL